MSLLQQNSHMKNRCPVKKNAYYGVKCVWVPKRTITDTQGLKKFWVPKTQKLFLQGSKKKKIRSGTWTMDVRNT